MSYWAIKQTFHILRRRLTYTSVNMYHSHQLNTQHVIVILFPGGKTPSLLTIKVGIEQLKTNDEKEDISVLVLLPGTHGNHHSASDQENIDRHTCKLEHKQTFYLSCSKVTI